MMMNILSTSESIRCINEISQNQQSASPADSKIDADPDVNEKLIHPDPDH